MNFLSGGVSHYQQIFDFGADLITILMQEFLMLQRISVNGKNFVGSAALA